MTGHVTGMGPVDDEVKKKTLPIFSQVSMILTPSSPLQCSDTWLNTEVWPINPTTIIKVYISTFQQHFLVPSCCHFDILLRRGAILRQVKNIQSYFSLCLSSPAVRSKLSQANTWCKVVFATSSTAQDSQHMLDINPLTPLSETSLCTQFFDMYLNYR